METMPIRFCSPSFLLLLCGGLLAFPQVKEAAVLDGRPLVDVSVIALEAGLDLKEINSAVKALLEENNIKALSNLIGDNTPTDFHSNDGRLIIYVHIIHMPVENRGIVAYHCTADFREWSSPLRKEAGYVQFAAVWSESTYGTVGQSKIADLRNCVMELAQKFALRYLKDNQAATPKP
jgi:hypothetical protein